MDGFIHKPLPGQILHFNINFHPVLVGHRRHHPDFHVLVYRHGPLRLLAVRGEAAQSLGQIVPQGGGQGQGRGGERTADQHRRRQQPHRGPPALFPGRLLHHGLDNAGALVRGQLHPVHLPPVFLFHHVRSASNLSRSMARARVSWVRTVLSRRPRMAAVSWIE